MPDTETGLRQLIRVELEEFLTGDDERQLAERGLSRQAVVSQIETIRRGHPPLRLLRACRVGDGIRVLAPGDQVRFASRARQAVAAGRLSHFIPASGAASRMFRALESVRRRHPVIDAACLAVWRRAGDADERDADERDALRFLERLPDLALHGRLHAALQRCGLDLAQALREGDRRPILDLLLGDRGLEAAATPKGLVDFHRYPDGTTRTAFAEHLHEAAALARDAHGVARVHFTVAAAHRQAVRAHLDAVATALAGPGLRFEVGLSIQEPSTDTIAVDARHRPLRDRSGRLLLRPAGHGALLGNLEALAGDLVFVKNIDNVAHARLATATRCWHRLLLGQLVEVEERAHAAWRELQAGPLPVRRLAVLEDFVAAELGRRPPAEVRLAPAATRRRYLLQTLHRPLRVCGMVRQQGEPGGGPFWVRGEGGAESLQIVEAAQVDDRSGAQQAILASATHFNPVFMMGALRDATGRAFPLARYVDRQAGLVTRKSSGGRELSALELPGLWNGSMDGWNTVFVEVPAATFNPVKTVLDLLREAHRAAAPARRRRPPVAERPGSAAS